MTSEIAFNSDGISTDGYDLFNNGRLFRIEIDEFRQPFPAKLLAHALEILLDPMSAYAKTVEQAVFKQYVTCDRNAYLRTVGNPKYDPVDPELLPEITDPAKIWTIISNVRNVTLSARKDGKVKSVFELDVIFSCEHSYVVTLCDWELVDCVM